MAKRTEVLRNALIRLIDIYVPSHYVSQAKMAEALGFSPAHFSQMKSGNRPIGKDSADRIEHGLGLGMGGLYRVYENNEFTEEMESRLTDLFSKYQRANDAKKALIDITLSGKSTPEWATNSIRHQHKALLFAITEALNNTRKKVK